MDGGGITSGGTIAGLPKWVVIGGVLVVIVAVLFARRGGAQAVSTVTPNLSDPEREATERAQIGARSLAFDSLASNFFGYRGTVSDNARDVNVSSLVAGRDIAVAGIDRDRTAISEYYGTQRVQLMETGATERQYSGDYTRRQLATEEQTGLTTRAGLDVTGRTTIAQGQQNLERYLADRSLDIARDTNRTALSQTESIVGERRQKNTNDAVNSGIQTICDGIVGFFTFGLAKC